MSAPAPRAYAVDVESAGLADPLLAMMAMVVDGGGFVAPGLRIVERGGAIRIERPLTAAPVQRLVMVPPSLLVPTDRLIWAGDPDRLRLAADPVHLSPERRDMLDLLLAIYDAAGKARWAQRHPMAVLRGDAALLALVRRIKPDAAVQTGPLAQMFIGNRQVTKGRLAGALQGVPLIMPVMDFLNHHADGDIFRFHHGQLAITEYHVGGSEECVSSYGGRRDAIDWAISHGWVDGGTCFVASSPVRLELPGIGRLVIEGLSLATNHEANPPRAQFGAGELRLSHAVFDIRQPAKTLGMLALPVRAWAMRERIDPATIDKALAALPDALLAANLAALDGFEAGLRAHPGSADTVALLRSASTVQRACWRAALGGSAHRR